MLPNIQNNNIKHIFPGKPRSWAQRITEESGRPDVGESVNVFKELLSASTWLIFL